jgi:serine/threonine protein kinase
MKIKIFHCDIKPENILIKINKIENQQNKKIKIEFIEIKIKLKLILKIKIKIKIF